MSSMQKLMKQAQQMQERLQRELAETVVEASVGGGMVTVKMSGHKQLVSVKIDPEVMDKDDPSMLEDLIVAAVNEAGRKVEETMPGRRRALAAARDRSQDRFAPRPPPAQGHCRRGAGARPGHRGGEGEAVPLLAVQLHHRRRSLPFLLRHAS